MKLTRMIRKAVCLALALVPLAVGPSGAVGLPYGPYAANDTMDFCILYLSGGVTVARERWYGLPVSQRVTYTLPDGYTLPGDLPGDLTVQEVQRGGVWAGFNRRIEGQGLVLELPLLPLLYEATVQFSDPDLPAEQVELGYGGSFTAALAPLPGYLEVYTDEFYFLESAAEVVAIDHTARTAALLVDAAPAAYDVTVHYNDPAGSRESCTLPYGAVLSPHDLSLPTGYVTDGVTEVALAEGHPQLTALEHTARTADIVLPVLPAHYVVTVRLSGPEGNTEQSLLVPYGTDIDTAALTPPPGCRVAELGTVRLVDGAAGIDFDHVNYTAEFSLPVLPLDYAVTVRYDEPAGAKQTVTVPYGGVLNTSMLLPPEGYFVPDFLDLSIVDGHPAVELDHAARAAVVTADTAPRGYLLTIEYGGLPGTEQTLILPYGFVVTETHLTPPPGTVPDGFTPFALVETAAPRGVQFDHPAQTARVAVAVRPR